MTRIVKFIKKIQMTKQVHRGVQHEKRMWSRKRRRRAKEREKMQQKSGRGEMNLWFEIAQTIPARWVQRLDCKKIPEMLLWNQIINKNSDCWVNWDESGDLDLNQDLIAKLNSYRKSRLTLISFTKCAFSYTRFCNCSCMSSSCERFWWKQKKAGKRWKKSGKTHDKINWNRKLMKDHKYSTGIHSKPNH